MKVLVLRFSSIGDIVLTTPVVRALRQQVGAEVHFATKAAFAPVLEANPYLAKVHLLGESLPELIAGLKKEKFDRIVDLHGNLRTLRVKTALGVKAHTFDKLNWQKWLYVNFKVDKLPNVHIVRRYLDAAKPLGVEDDGDGLDYFIPEKDFVERDWLPEEFRVRYAAFAIGGQHATKRLPLERMIELCDRINKPVVLLGGKGDFETGERIAEFFVPDRNAATEEKLQGELGKRTVVFNACGKFGLNQSASLVAGAYAVFTHDTAMMHVAAAFQKQVYCIWGSTTPKFGMYPYRTKFVVFENNRLKCRPCSKIGYERCPKGHFKCMRDVVFDFYLP